MDMKIRKPLKHKGFINIPRRVTLLLRDGNLDFGDYGFYNFLLHEVDWYKPHPTFGCIPKTDIDLAIDGGCHPSTISRRKAKLLKYGLIEITENGYMKIKDFEKFTMRVAMKLSHLEVATLHEDIAQTQSIIAEVQSQIANSQHSRHETEDSFNTYPHKGSKVSNDEHVNPDDIPF